jgi:hypothetical protein
MEHSKLGVNFGVSNAAGAKLEGQKPDRGRHWPCERQDASCSRRIRVENDEIIDRLGPLVKEALSRNRRHSAQVKGKPEVIGSSVLVPINAIIAINYRLAANRK